MDRFGRALRFPKKASDREGMNLVAKEFIACQRENAGLLILSEFAGAAEELFNALLVNPYDSAAVAGTLTDAGEAECRH